MSLNETAENHHDVAIIGMALRVPGASSVEAFWKNLCEGVESITQFTEEELFSSGVDPAELANPNYIKAGLVLDDMKGFDARFFGISPKDAAIMDPQHRHFLECGWEVLEDACHPPEQFDGTIGVFAGCGMGAYFAFNILNNQELLSNVGLFLLRHTGNDKDFLATRLSYSLNLTGPSVNVQTACSTSLVATHMASTSLLNYECDIALAGGVTIEIPHRRGYLFKPGEILSPDGHCRAFDHRAAGTLFGSGVGMVALRRLSDALADNDAIYAVIRGSAVNNDGSAKVGYLAPGVDGQASAIVEALAVADVHPDTVDYVECHGTGTEMGDPIEMTALTRAFRMNTERKGYCGVGSVKTNIGHLDTAAGVVSLIKTALAVYHGKMPPSLNFQKANPNIDFINSPFFVNDKLRDWPDKIGPRRACVNSLGVGGANAHVVLEQPPKRHAEKRKSRPFHLLTISAKSRSALDQATKNLGEHLAKYEPDLADASYTLLMGRSTFDFRRVAVCANASDAANVLLDPAPFRLFTHEAGKSETQTLFMFPGGGVQYPNMAKDLYDTESLFAQILDEGLTILADTTSYDYRAVLFPKDPETVLQELEKPSVQLPLIFLIEYALARLFIDRGIKPVGFLGHSLGENTAACLAGVFSFSDALGLVTLRGQLFETLPTGGMLSVYLSQSDLEAFLPPDLDLAVINGPEICVVSGQTEALETFASSLAKRQIEFRRIRIKVAAHSRILDPILDTFRNYLKNITLKPPTIPFISNLSGDWISPERASDPEYWVEHLRGTVRFSDGLKTALNQENRTFLEVGPGSALCSLAHMMAVKTGNLIPSLRRADEAIDDNAFLLTALGRLWACGVDLKPDLLCPTASWTRLPTYPFQHRNYWIEPRSSKPTASNPALVKISNKASWRHVIKWKEFILEKPVQKPLTWWIFADNFGVADRFAETLKKGGHETAIIREGDAFYRQDALNYRLPPEQGLSAYLDLTESLLADGKIPHRIAHFWSLTLDKSFRPGSSFYHHSQERGFYSLFFLGKAFIDANPEQPIHMNVVVNGMASFNGERVICPTKATLLGPCKVMPREMPGLSCAVIDIHLPKIKKGLLRNSSPPSEKIQKISDLVAADLLSICSNGVFARRRKRIWAQTWTQQTVKPDNDTAVSIREKGVYLITGGLGGLALALAEHLASRHRANLALIARRRFPEPAAWDDWLANHGSANSTSSHIRTIRRLEKMGARVLVLQADVADISEMRAAIEAATKMFGVIHGAFHTAGVLKDAPLGMKTWSEAASVLSPKVQGALVLDEVLEHFPLDFIALFSSSSTAIAPAGQVDYVAANEFLNAFALSKIEKSGARVVAINWGLWNKVGMTARLMDQVFDQGHHQKQNALHPLLESWEKDKQGWTVLTGHLRCKSHWVVDQHRTANGHALLPGTAYIELAKASLREIGETRPFELKDLIFLRPLFVEENEEKRFRIKLRPVDADYALEAQSLISPETTAPGWETHVLGRLAPCRTPEIKTLDLQAILNRCPTTREASGDSGLKTGQWSHLRFGARWHVIRRICLGKNEALAELQLPQGFDKDLKHWLLHPALLDMATGFPMDLVSGYDQIKESQLYVPLSYGSIRIHGPLPSRIFSWASNRRPNDVKDETIAFDFVITDKNGHILLEIMDFSLKKLESATIPQIKPLPADLEEEPEFQTERSFSNSELALKNQLEQGINPKEGMQFLEEILTKGSEPVVLITSLDLQAQIKQTEELNSQVGTNEEKFTRPELSSEFAEPSDEVERVLASFWESLLGIEKVGVDDSFFDLGGHSLIAVRLFAKIKETFHVSYPISVLFEAPTIRRCAAMLREAGEQSNRAGDQGRHTHLVAMHTGKSGPKTPFFLVAGMFGNVLNLRHLAHLVGAERPFYGLQARGLHGDEQPHNRFEDMAADYLEEIQSVQPHGPYLLGGFSGGGITAYEMAQQLLAQGEEVKSLILLDTPLPYRPPLQFKDKMHIHLLRLREERLGYLKEWAVNRLNWELERFKKKQSPSPAAQALPAGFHSAKIESAFRQALSCYDLKPYSGKVTLFRPALDRRFILSDQKVVSSEREYIFDDNGWTPYVGNLEIQEVPGNHDSMVLEPNVRTLAAHFAACLEKDDRP